MDVRTLLVGKGAVPSVRVCRPVDTKLLNPIIDLGEPLLRQIGWDESQPDRDASVDQTLERRSKKTLQEDGCMSK